MGERRRTSPAEAWKLAFDVMVFAPLGLGAAIVEEGPEAVRRGRQELRNARFIGQMAVDRGVAEIKRRVDEAGAQRPGPTAIIDVGPIEHTPESTASVDELDADDLALPDYETLPAIDIVDKLEHLTADERAAIERYERAHRQRRTVLGKLAQLGDD